MGEPNPTAEVADLSGFDIRAKSQDGVDMPLLDPAGRATRVVLRVRGSDCRAYQDMLQDHIRRGIERAPRKSTEGEKNAEWWELNATLVAAWSPAKLVVDRDGAELECTPANVAGVLERHAWIFEQVRRFADKRANFLPGSSSS